MMLQLVGSPYSSKLRKAPQPVHYDGRWVAFERSCPHAGIDLLRGDIEDLGFGPIIGCPAHSYLWHTQSGTCLWDSARPGAVRYPNMLYLRLQLSETQPSSTRTRYNAVLTIQGLQLVLHNIGKAYT
eukprot:2421849-Amphidinium_carterae.1